MFNLLWKNTKEIFHNKKIVIITIVVSFIVVAGIVSGVLKEKDKGGEPLVRLGIIDLENNIYSNILLSYFQDNDYFNGYVDIVKKDQKDIVSLFENGDIDAYVEIPNGFIEKLMYVENMPLKVRINGDNTMTAIILKNVLESYEKYISAVEVSVMSLYDTMEKEGMEQELIDDKNIEISYSLIMTALGRADIFLKNESKGFPSTTLPNYYMFAFMAIFLMYFGLSIGLDMLKENKNRTLQRYLIINKGIFRFVFSKIVASVLSILLVSAFLYLIVIVFTSLQFNLFLVINYMVFTCFFITLGLFVSGFFSNRNTYMLTGNMIYFIMAIIGGGLIPVMYLPQNIINIAYFTPNYWFVRNMLLLQEGYIGKQVKVVIFTVILLISVMMGCILFTYCRKEAVNE